MKTITKSIITVATLSLLLAGCESKDKAPGAAASATTIEEIQAQKGKPARVAKSIEAKVVDVRSFSGSIEGSKQVSAIAKMSDPIAKVNVHVGSTVQKDQVLAEFVFTGDNSGYQQAEAQVQLLEKSLSRLKEVQTKGGIAQQDIDQLETQLNVAKMQLEQARRATLVLSPAEGTVTEVHFTEGEVPGVGGKMFTIAKLDKVILKLNVTSKDIGFFKKGTRAKIDLNGETFVGSVTTVPLAANSQTRFFPVEVTFNNKGRKLLPGMFLTTQIDARLVNGVTVPAEAIFYRNGMNMVWTVDENGKAKRKIVEVSVQTKETAVIKSGLEAGETVMTEGMSKMNDGDKVLIVE